MKMIVTPEEMNIPKQIGDFAIKPISWADFPAKGPEPTWFLAESNWNDTYDIISVKGKGFYVKAKSNIAKTSWVNKEHASKRLLRHEYGHYLICCLAALHFRKEANETGRKMLELQ